MLHPPHATSGESLAYLLSNSSSYNINSDGSGGDTSEVKHASSWETKLLRDPTCRPRVGHRDSLCPQLTATLCQNVVGGPSRPIQASLPSGLSLQMKPSSPSTEVPGHAGLVGGGALEALFSSDLA